MSDLPSAGLTATSAGSRDRLRLAAQRRYSLGAEVATAFFEAEADLIADACLEMARRFRRGGRLLAFGEGAAASDAQHVAVEFVHPVLVGKRALPALALRADGAMSAASDEDTERSFAAALATLGHPQDIALAITGHQPSPAVTAGLRRAQGIGMLTVVLEASGSRGDTSWDFRFPIPSADPFIVQECHETLYHVFWELVHVFFEHRVV